VLLYSCSSFTYRTYDIKELQYSDDPEPNYDYTLDRNFQQFTDFMYLGNKVENFGTFFNTYYNAKDVFNDAYETYTTKVLSTYSSRIDSIYINPVLDAQTSDEFHASIEKASRIIQFHKSTAFMDKSVLLIGKAYYYLGDYLKAERKFSEFASKLSASPLLEEDLLFYSMTQFRLGNSASALARVEQLIKDSKDNAIISLAYQSIAEYNLNKKDYKAAIEAYKKSIEFSKDSQFRAQMQFLLASVVALNDYKEAALEFERVLDYNATFDLEYLARYNRLKYLILGNDFDAASPMIEYLRIKYKDYPDYEGQIEFQQGFYYEQKKDYKKALEAYKVVMQKYPHTSSSASASFQVAKYYEQDLKDYLNAYRYFRYSTEENTSWPYFRIAQNKTNTFKKYYDLRSTIAGFTINTDYDSLFNLATKGEGYINQNSTNTNTNNNGDNTNGNNNGNQNNNGNNGNPPKGKGGGNKGFDNLSSGSRFMDSTRDKFKGFIKSPMKDTLREKLKEKDTLKSTGKDTLKESSKDSLTVSIDSTAIKNQAVAQAKFELAEEFDYDFKNADSSEYYYLSAFDQSEKYEFKSRVLFALSDLYRSMGKDTKADSVLKQIVDVFPSSNISAEARKLLHMEDNVERDAGDSIYSYSEDRFNSGDYETSLGGFKQLLGLYPNSRHANKSMYCIGWIYENVLNKPDSAYKYYSSIDSLSPNSDFAAAVSGKVKEYKDTLLFRAGLLDSTKSRDTSKVTGKNPLDLNLKDTLAMNKKDNNGIVPLLKDSSKVEPPHIENIQPDTSGKVQLGSDSTNKAPEQHVQGVDNRPPNPPQPNPQELKQPDNTPPPDNSTPDKQPDNNPPPPPQPPDNTQPDNTQPDNNNPPPPQQNPPDNNPPPTQNNGK